MYIILETCISKMFEHFEKRNEIYYFFCVSIEWNMSFLPTRGNWGF